MIESMNNNIQSNEITEKPAMFTPQDYPNIANQCLVKLGMVYDFLKTAEKRAANYIISNPEEFATGNITAAAKKADCSEATMIRLSKRLGFSGFTELKSNVLRHGRDDLLDYYYNNISQNEHPSGIAEGIFASCIKTLTDTLAVFDEKSFSEAAQLIYGAERIVFFGLGDAANTARSGYEKFLRLGYDSRFSEDLDITLITISQMSATDALVLISHSGRTKPVIELAKHARKNKINVILLTTYPMSQAAKNADIILPTACFITNDMQEVVAKRVVELCFLECLYIRVIQMEPERFKSAMSNTTLWLNINKNK